MEDKAETPQPEQDDKLLKRKILAFVDLVDDNLNYALAVVTVGSIIFGALQESKKDRLGAASIAFISVIIFHWRNYRRPSLGDKPLSEKRERQVEMIFNVVVLPVIIGLFAYLAIVIIFGSM